ncbi:MAG TPA: MFS transporter [Candidatus Dormibacteraeota bacterium]|nr:MFS transporter [Candidatus Dormibacteraeota bacterium]
MLGRVAGRMVAVALVLFVLSRYRSPQLAGAAVFLFTFPGLLISPLAGALLDRYGRARLVTVDYLVAGAMLSLLAALSTAHALPPALLLLLCGLASLTGPLGIGGARSLVPSLVPGHLWERANALDSSSDVFTGIVGAPLAGVLVGLAGGEVALAASGVLFGLAGLAMLTVRDRAFEPQGGPLLAEAWSGLLYVLRNRTLVGLALTFFAFSVGWGCLVIAVPVLVLGRLHQGPATVGYLWGLVGVAGLAAMLFVGRIRTEGRERQLMAGSILAMAAVMAVMPFAGSVVVVAAALIGVALVETPFDLAFLTLRQRRSDPTRFGRVFAVSVSLNMLGGPVGSAIAGPLVAWSLNAALWVAVASVAVAAVFPILFIPARDHRPNGR